MTAATPGVLREMRRERERPQARWGEQHLSPAVWRTVLGEEVREANQAALEHLLGNVADLSHDRKELLQVAAVAVQAVESLDRQRAARSDGPDFPA